MRSSAIKLPSGPTTAIETGAPISSAFSIAALMNSRHSTARNFAMCFPDVCELFAKAGRVGDVAVFFCLAGNIGAEFFRRAAFHVQTPGGQQLRGGGVLQRLVQGARE